jgi:nucleoside-diphosphate-sugar epimerase
MTLDPWGPVFVTGAAGFVGAGATHALLDLGHEVHVLLRPTSRPWRLRSVWSRLHVHRADLLDPGAVRESVRRARPGVILHLATHGAYEHQADARRIFQTNLLGTYNLLEAAAEQGARLVVNAGSSSEYGLKTGPMCEVDRLEPNSFYAIAKAAQTHLCAFMSRRASLPVVTFRLFSVYGPWEEPARLVPTLIRRARAELPIEMAAPATARDFIYLEDVVSALLGFPRLAEHAGETFNLGTGQQTTLEEVVCLVLELVGSRSEVRWGVMPARQWDSTAWRADTSLTGRQLGWAPRFSLREGLTRTIAWMAERGDEHEATCADAAA